VSPLDQDRLTGEILDAMCERIDDLNKKAKQA